MSTNSISGPRYRGRFAPSPTGPLHFGSLVAAVGSYVLARQHHGDWFVRIDDLDTPRVVEHADSEILRCLDAYGLHWDGVVAYQSSRLARYEEILQRLIMENRVFFCHCSRQEIAAIASIGTDGPVYPGTCRANSQPEGSAAVRIRSEASEICFDDLFQGHICQQLERDVGDFIIKRADGLFAYQLAIVVDDADQQISEIIRGADLINSTPRQIYLQRLLGFRTPSYGHLPVLINKEGQKLSKQSLAPPVSLRQPGHALANAFIILGQDLPGDLLHADARDIWQWANECWDSDKIPAAREILTPLDML